MLGNRLGQLYRKTSALGYTLTEVIVVVAIVGIIATIVWPTYEAQSRKNRRTSAISALTQIQVEVERCYASRGGYDCCQNQDNVLGTVLTVAPNTDDGMYTITYTPNNVDNNLPVCKRAQGYTLTATPIAGSGQDGDSCTSFTLDHLGNRTALDDGAPQQPKPACWGD